MTVMVFGASTDVLLRVVLLIIAVLLFNSQLALANISDGQKKQFSGLIMNTETRPNWYGGSLNGRPGIDGSRGDGPDHSEGQPIIRRLLQATIGSRIPGPRSGPKTGQGSTPTSEEIIHPHINPKGQKDPSTDPVDGTSCQGPECKPKVVGPGETPKLPDPDPVKPDPQHPVPSGKSDDLPDHSPPPPPVMEPSPPPVKSTTYHDDQPPPPPITIPSPLPHSDESTSNQAGYYYPPPTPISASARSVNGAGKLMRREDALVSTIPLILLGYFLA